MVINVNLILTKQRINSNKTVRITVAWNISSNIQNIQRSLIVEKKKLRFDKKTKNEIYNLKTTHIMMIVCFFFLKWPADQHRLDLNTIQKRK